MNGSIGRQAEKVQAFVRRLAAEIKVPVEFRDERLTTVSAQKLKRSSGKAASKASDDALAAAFILQSYLDEREIR